MTPTPWDLESGELLAAMLIGLLVMSFLYKLIRKRRNAYGEVRRAAYIAAMEELVYREGYPQDMLQKWVKDRVFRDVVVEYLKFLDGEHRQRLLCFANEFGVSEALQQELSSIRKSVRSAAAEGLSQMGDEAVILFPATSLANKEQGVRINAAHALAIGPKHAAIKPRHYNPQHRAPRARDRHKGRHRP